MAWTSTDVETQAILGQVPFNEFGTQEGPSYESPYVYVGGILENGDWQINRFDTTNNYVKTRTNSGAANLTAAWAIRDSLTYT